jgi:hypothetical protein
MPLGSFSELVGEKLSIQSVLDLRKRFDVSVESCLIRLVKLARHPCAAFCASVHSDQQYHIDYVIPALGWNSSVRVGQRIRENSVVHEVNAIGFTAVGCDEWTPGRSTRVECVGLAPYPGSVVPRVVGLLLEIQEQAYEAPAVVELDGDALKPRGIGPRLIAHIVPDTTALWGGNGFASQVRRRFPEVWTKYRHETVDVGRSPRLGEVFAGPLNETTDIVHMVAQRGIGPSKGPRLRYAPLAECLALVRELAKKHGASVHMPRIGTGHGGASWDVVRELITQELVYKGVPTTVYRLPT